MSSLVPWKLLLFLCATSFGEQLAKAAPMENPRTLGLRMAWERGPRGWSGGGGEGALSPREARLCPAAAARCAPRGGGGGGGGGRPSPAPRGAVLVQREKDLAAAAYNWNSFGLRYGKRLAAAAAPGAGGPGGRGGREPAGLGAGTPPPPPPPPLLGRRRRRDGQ